MIKNTSLAGIITGIMVFFLPFVASTRLFYGATNAKYFFLISFVYIFALLFAYEIIKGHIRISLYKRYLLILLTIVLIVEYLALLFGIFAEHSLWSDIIRSSGVIFITHIAALAFFLSELLRKEDWIFGRRIFILSTTLFSLLYFLGTEGIGFTGKFLSINFSVHGFTFGNSTFAGTYILFGLLFTLIEIIETRRKSKEQFIYIAFLLIQLLSPLLLNSRLWLGMTPIKDLLTNPLIFFGTAQASSVTAFLVVVYFLIREILRRVSKEQFRSQILLAHTIIWGIGILTALILLFTPGTFLQNRYIAHSTEARILIWQGGIEGFLERPILGWGPENFSIAFQGHTDNRLYLDENIGEVWFDRAHNYFVDMLTTRGIVGTAIMLFFLIYLGSIFIRAGNRGIVNKNGAHLFCVLLVANILQLQTSFDTPASYFALMFVIGYGLFLEKQMIIRSPTQDLKIVRYGLVGLLLIFVVFGARYALFAEASRQKALYLTFTESNSENRKVLIKKAISQISDFHTLRFASNSLVKGVLTDLEGHPERVPKVVPIALEELAIYTDAYEQYLNRIPTDYRARMNTAYLYLIMTAFGDNNIARARELIDTSYELAPKNPLTYVLAAITELYSGEVKEAKEKITEGLLLNPDVPMTIEAASYIDTQIKHLPSITIFQLENL